MANEHTSLRVALYRDDDAGDSHVVQSWIINGENELETLIGTLKDRIVEEKDPQLWFGVFLYKDV